MELIILIILAIIFYVISNLTQKKVISRWHHLIEDFNYSSQDFYNKVQESLTKRKVTGISIDRSQYFEGSVLGSKREYLQIKRNHNLFEICAAPYGTGYFVSWWLVDNPGFFKSLMRKLDKGGIFSDYKTYYQCDTEDMFKETIHKAVLEIVKEITNDKGIRGMTELEVSPVDNPQRRM